MGMTVYSFRETAVVDSYKLSFLSSFFASLSMFCLVIGMSYARHKLNPHCTLATLISKVDLDQKHLLKIFPFIVLYRQGKYSPLAF